MADLNVAIHSLTPDDNLRVAYHTLTDRVGIALRTQVGDTARLGETRTQAFNLLEAAEQV